MKTSKVFRKAKALLKTGKLEPAKNTYICTAIIVSAAPYCDIKRATGIIADLLGHPPALEDWLVAQGIHKVWFSPEKVQQTRHAWLDHLIEHYEGLGD